MRLSKWILTLTVPATLLAAAATLFLFGLAVAGAAKLGTELALRLLR